MLDKTQWVKKQNNSIAIAILVACMTAILYAGTVTAGDDSSVPATPEQIQSLNAAQEQVFRDIPQPDQKAANALIDKVYERSGIPVIVRLRDKDLPYGFFSDKKKPRAEVIDALQSEVVADVIAQTSGDEAGLHVKRFHLIPAMALLVDVPELEALMANSNVIDIVEDIPVPPTLQDSVPLIGAGPDGSFSGYTGQGQTVAILDTGVDKNHEFLSGKVVSEACYSNYYGLDTSLCPGGATSSTAPDSALPCASLCAHGTHVAGIAAGMRITLLDTSKISGVAKDAKIIAIQVFTQFNNASDCLPGSAPCVLSYTSDQILGLERVYALRSTYSIASVNISIGGGKYTASCDTDLAKPVIDMLRAAGIATVIASGNNSYIDAMSAPACISSAVSVGSTTKTDAVSSFSNSADFLSLLAPGSSITSSVPGIGYETWSGTSMAAPHVAGAWAVLKQYQSGASVTDILNALQTSGVPVTDTRIGANNRIKPTIDVQAALAALGYCADDTDCGDGVCLDNVCVECAVNGDCEDDALYCTGLPVCMNNVCGFEPDSCGGDTPFCNETIRRCVECLANSLCEDNLFCTGVETCVDGACSEGAKPCTEHSGTPFCDETEDLCVECLDAGDCADDSLYCTGSPICMDGICAFEPDHCEGDTPFCNETNNRCVECLGNSDCADDLFCTGPQMCANGVCEFKPGPCGGDTPACDEDNNQCVECLADAHCETFFSCESNECVPFPVTSPFTTVTLKGPGMMDVIFYPNMRDIAWIHLTKTTDDSSLTITRRLKNFDVNLDGLDVIGSLKAIKGKNVVLTGALTATGGIEKIQLAGTESGSTIKVPWIGTLLVTEYFDGDMTLTGTASPPKGLTLGKAFIKGWLRNSQWLIDGNVGSVKVDLWGAGSIVAVGVDPGIDGHFFTKDDVATGGWLEKLTYKYYDTDNGKQKFGIIADEILNPKTVFLEAGDFCVREIQ